MNIKRLAAASALVIASMTMAAGAAYATPADTAAPQSNSAKSAQQAIHYNVSRSGDSALITTDAGSLTTSANQLEVRDAMGQIVTGVPLTYIYNDQAFPIAAHVDGNTATLTPSRTPVAGSTARSMGLPLHQVDLSTAVTTVMPELTLAATTGAILGAVVGGGGGCLAGALLGLGATAPLLGLLGAGPLAGCAVGALTMAPVGGVAGSVLVGGPTLLAVGFQFIQLLQQPPAPKK